ncbi:ABC1 kinase family protein [Clostridium cavendishii]|nr:AarF/ABC1/UbiB kinase family protein [Clostridium cavendishii]
MKRKGAKRFSEIVRVFAGYGFGYLLDSKNNNSKSKSPENLRKAFEELGPTFIKIGQILSTRPDILPKEYIDELEKLQDSINKDRIEKVKDTFFNEFNISIDDAFNYFEEEPIASASIAQVHRAQLKDGKSVVVKIQHEDIKEKMDLDIKILMKLARITKSRFKNSIIDPIEALQEIKDATEAELDFNLEASNMIKFKNLNKGVVCVYSPSVIKQYSKVKVITMEAIEGFKINDIRRLEGYGYDRKDVAKKLALSFCKQIFNDGFFHGDPHPGNLLIYDGCICYIDFGIVGELSDNIRKWMNEAIIAIATKDIDKVISFIMAVGIKKGKVTTNRLYEDLDYLFESYLTTSLKNIRISLLLEEIFSIAKNNNIQLPKDLVSLIRAMVVLEGVVAQIEPDIEILDVIIPFVKSKNKAYIKEKIDKDELAFKLYTFTNDTIKLPSKIVDFINTCTRGRLKVQLKVDSLNSYINQLNKMVNRVVFGFIVAAMIVSSSMILNSNVGPKVQGVSIIGITGYVIAAVFGLWLMISIIRSGFM